MEIVYIWIGNYKQESDDTGLQLENQGFNFGGRFLFDYDRQTELLSMRKNPIWQDNFFRLLEQKGKEGNLAKVLNVTAVVGENGAGKTTLLNFTKNDLVYGGRVQRQKAVLVFWDDKKETHHIYHHVDMVLKIRACEGVKYEKPILYRDTEEDGKPMIGIPAMKENTIVFFSNVFDNRVNEKEYIRLRNISTNFLMHKDRVGMQEQKVNDIVAHRFREVQRQIEFVRDFPRYGGGQIQSVKKLFKRLPSELLLRFPDYDLGELFESTDDAVEFFDEVSWQLGSANLGDEDGFRNHLTRVLFRHVVAELCEILAGDSTILTSIFDEYHLLQGENTYSKFQSWLRLLATEKRYEGLIGELADGVLQFYGIILANLGKYGVGNETKSLTIDISRAFDIVDKIMGPYQQATLNRDFMAMDWRDLSSGEKSLLNLYSRFFYTAVGDGLNKNELTTLRDNITVLIDEGELYFHPQWQKELLYNLLSFLPLVFRKLDTTEPNEQRRIQIIMTSNSPFMVSDLPNTNVIFLKREEEDGKSRVIDGLEDQQQTFAANIHSLFTNSFFLTGGLMGKFAKEKINDTIHLLLNESVQTIMQQKDEVTKTIDIIGEPVIKNKLINMYKDKMSLDYLFLEERLEERLEKKMEKRFEDRILELQAQVEALLKMNEKSRGDDE